ncbi:hypothetical protein EJ08DRAFT_646633 [Tothia fuscella]|uniref:2EXR domain-containing protein n=1 Tax=Tothia fuscella TaxID=1048955 RepID=A0A9P4NYV1_9PEZI|nr:hypothetical protein EJ08DRAFT_646633 [Tothia fuscella]
MPHQGSRISRLSINNTHKTLNTLLAFSITISHEEMDNTAQFHLFQELPSELRLEIYRLALQMPRVVNITCDAGPKQRNIPRTAKSFHSDNCARPPSLLHVCHESRREALKVYKPHFQTQTSAKYIYFSTTQDTIKATDSVLQFLDELELRVVHKLDLFLRDPAYFGHFNLDYIKNMQPTLKELDLSVRQTVMIPPWNRRNFVKGVMNDVRIAAQGDREWVRPNIRCLDLDSGRFEEILASEIFEEEE